MSEFEKPLVIRQWLDGVISTEVAIIRALASDDPAARIWGEFMYAQGTMRPTSIITICGV